MRWLSVSACIICPHIFIAFLLPGGGSPTPTPCSPAPPSSYPPLPRWPGVLSPDPAVSSICLVLMGSFCSILRTCTLYLFASLQFRRSFGVQCGVSELTASQLGHPPSAESGSCVLCAPCCGPLCGLSLCGAGHFHAGNALFSLWLKLPCPLRNLAQ